MRETMNRQSLSLLTHESSGKQRKIALVTGIAIATAAMAVLPAAQLPLGEVKPFFPAFISSVIIVELLTAYLLYTQFRISRTPSVAVLATTYLFSALVAIPHFLTFPGVFSETGYLNAGPQTAVWYWVFWHGGFPAGILLYLFSEKFFGKKQLTGKQGKWLAVGLVTFVLMLISGFHLLSTQYAGLLPAIISKNNYRILITSGIGPTLLVLNAIALAGMVGLTRGKSTAQLWLCVAVLASLLDVSVTLAAGSRYSLGWYMARLNSFVSASIVLGALIFEINYLYWRLLEGEQRLKSLFVHNPDAVYSLDVDGRFVSANPASANIIGYQEKELFQQHSRTLIAEKDRQAASERFSQALRGEPQTYELSVLHAQGHSIDISVTNIPISVNQEIVGVYGIAKDITDRKRTAEQIHHMAFHDALTDLPNRRMFKQLLKEYVDKAKVTGETIAVMFLDLDRFKFVNDTLGHEAGDLLLREVTARLLTVTDQRAIVARMGGDEFTVLMSGEETEVAALAEQVRDIVSKPYEIWDQTLHISTSVGISLFPHDSTDADVLLKYADNAMYFAKEQGKNNVQFYGKSAKDSALQRLALENDLRKAIEREELVLHYQPLVNTYSGEMIGVEALVRWNHPVKGMIPPGVFIPIAEESGLIVPIGEWVLRTACVQNKAWQDAGLPKIRVAVNLSMYQFQKADIVKTVAEALKDSGLEPEYLELEITETMAMRQVDSTIFKLQALKDLGLHISVDDFGTGYSSLNYLKRFPIDSVKVDRSFVNEITNDTDDAAIVTAIIAMAHSLKLDVVAEGVETEEQIAFLRELRCDEMQGYFFSHPVPVEQMTELLTKQLPHTMDFGRVKKNSIS